MKKFIYTFMVVAIFVMTLVACGDPVPADTGETSGGTTAPALTNPSNFAVSFGSENNINYAELKWDLGTKEIEDILIYVKEIKEDGSGEYKLITADDSPIAKFTQTIAKDATSVRIPGLIAGKKYQFKINFKPKGEEILEIEKDEPIEIQKDPSLNTFLGRITGINTVLLEWTISEGILSDKEISNFDIKMKKGEEEEQSLTTTGTAEKLGAGLNKDSRSVSVTGLAKDVTYVFTITPSLIEDTVTEDGKSKIASFPGDEEGKGNVIITSPVISDMTFTPSGSNGVVLRWKTNVPEKIGTNDNDKRKYLEDITVELQMSKEASGIEPQYTTLTTSGDNERLNATLQSSATSAEIINLVVGTSYQFKVVLKNASSEEISFEEISDVILTTDAKIGNARGEVKGLNEVELTWNNIPASTGGKAIKGLTVEMKKGNAQYIELPVGGSTGERLSTATLPDSTKATVRGLEVDTQYQFRLKEILTDDSEKFEDILFDGNTSVTINNPSFTKSSVAINTDEKKAELEWELSNGRFVDSIIIEMKKGDGEYETLVDSGTSERLEIALNKSSTQATVLNLVSNTDTSTTTDILYSFRIVARLSDDTRIDEADFTNFLGAKEVFIPRNPTIEVIPIEANDDRTEFTLKWKEIPGTDNGLKISRYEIAVKINSAAYTPLTTTGDVKLASEVVTTNLDNEVKVLGVNNITNNYEFKITTYALLQSGEDIVLDTDAGIKPDPALKFEPGDTLAKPIFNPPADGVTTFTKQIIVDKLNALDPADPPKYTIDNYHSTVQILVIPDGYTEVARLNDTTITTAKPRGDSVLQQIVLPSTLRSLPVQAFSTLLQLEVVRIPEGAIIPETSTNLFTGSVGVNSNLREVEWPSSSTVIPTNTFAYTPNLQTFIIPNGVTTIKSSAFLYSGITSLDIPNSVTTIEDNAFSNTKGLLEMKISGGVKYSVAQEATPFIGSNIQTVTFKEGFTRIPRKMFKDVTTLRVVNLPQSLISIGSDAFNNTKLSSITIPPGVVIDGNNPRYSVVFYEAPLKEFVYQYSKAKQSFFGERPITHDSSLYPIKLPIQTLKFEPITETDGTKDDIDISKIPNNTYTFLSSLTRVEYYSSTVISGTDLTVLQAKFPSGVTLENTHPNPQ